MLLFGLIPAGMAQAASGPKVRAAPVAMQHRPGQSAARRVPPLIVIDPGHGGRDAGAVGVSGTREKDITLATARELERQIKAIGRYRVALTRNADLAVPLASRVGFAKRNRAALFISIHADASADRSAQGASVYTKSRTTNGSRITEFAARPGNAGAIAEALSGGGAHQPSPGSAWLQYRLIDNLNDDVRMLREPVRQAHLYVLGKLGIPGALLEMGFLSNRQDEKLLKQPKHRAIIARAIREAIDDYFNDVKHPGAART
jgi:N-acetylmuramoyl-L-alanine amidase